MDSAGSWGNSSAVKSEIWGNSSSVLGSSGGSTGSFAQNSDRSSSCLGNPRSAWNSSGAKVMQAASNSNVWPGSEISAKQDVGKWGMGGLSGGSGGGGSGNQSVQNDTDSWRSSGTNSWTSSEKNDISGWGSPNRSPVPHAGTDGRGSKTAQNDERMSGWPSDSRSNNGYLQPDPRQASGSWSEATANNRSKQSQWGTSGNSSSGSASGAWSRGNSIAQPSQSVPTVGNPQPQQNAPSSWAQAVTNKSGQSGAGSASCGAAAGAAPPDDSKASSLRRSQEELIAQAINSNDGWGKTAIRQDTAWLIEDTMAEQRKAPCVPEATSEETAAQLTRQMTTGTAIWESSKAASATVSRSAAEKSTEDRSAWSGTPVEKTNVVVASNPANGPANPSSVALGSSPASTFRPQLDKPSGNMWPPGGSSEKPTGWGTGSTSSEGSWEGGKKDEDRVWDLDSNKGSKTETGVWDRPLRRSSSSGSWTGDEVENVGWGEDKPPRHPPEVDDGTSVWGDPGSQNRPQNWKPGGKSSAGPSQLLGQRTRPDERGDGFFGAPPASIGLKPGAFSEQMEGSLGPWNPSLPPPRPDSGGGGGAGGGGGGWGDGHWPNASGQRPQKASSMSGAWDINDWMSGSRRQNDFSMPGVSGAKGPTPQRSVVLQQLLSMGFRKEDAQNALISNNMNLDSAISELLNSRLRPDPEVSDLQRGRMVRPSDDLTSDTSLDTNSLLFGLPNLGQLNNNPFNIAGGGANPQQALASQQRPLGPTSLQAFGSSLGNQPSGLPDFSSLLQRTNQVMNNSVLTPPHQQQQQQLMQQLMQNVQAAIQLGLLPSNMMKPQMLMNNSFVINVQRLLQLYEVHQKLSEQCQLIHTQHQGTVLSSVAQQRLVEFTITIVGLQQQIDQVKQQIIHMSSMPTSAGSLPPVDQLLKGLQVKDDSTVASRLMSQWKIDNDADVKPAQHSTGLDMPITESTWMPMSSTSSASSWSGSAAAAAAEDASSGGTGITANGASLDGKVQSSAGISLTSTLSSTTAAVSESAVASSAGGAPVPAPALDIEEFVPGKLWQGPSTKNVEDDPYITPGSVTRNSLSTINDIQVMNILGKNSNSVEPSRGAGALGKSGSSQSLQSPAPHSNAWLNEPPPLLSVDPWGRNPALPPGLHIQSKPQWQYNRSVSWAPGDRSEYASMMKGWSTASSNWLVFKNLPPQVDNGTLHTLCVQHGQVLKFFPNVSRNCTLVGYAKTEDAVKAQRSLHSCKFGNTQLMVDLITENDVAHLLEANGRGVVPQPNSFTRPPLPSLASNYSTLHQGQLNRPEQLAGQWGGTAGGAGLGGGSSWNAIGAGNSWLPGFEDHGAAFLPGDLLGGQ